MLVRHKRARETHQTAAVKIHLKHPFPCLKATPRRCPAHSAAKPLPSRSSSYDNSLKMATGARNPGQQIILCRLTTIEILGSVLAASSERREDFRPPPEAPTNPEAPPFPSQKKERNKNSRFDFPGIFFPSRFACGHLTQHLSRRILWRFDLSRPLI